MEPVCSNSSEESKDYLADITFGVGTDSADGDGIVTATSIDRPEEFQVNGVLSEFLGEIDQIPPAHSAIRIGGRRAYELAHAGIAVDMPIRRVFIDQLELCKWDGETATVFVSCSKGTYIRSLARDIGVRLGIPSYMSNLVRTRSGPFMLENAWTTEDLGNMDPAWFWEDIALHPDAALSSYPAIVLSADESVRWSHGQAISRPEFRDDSRARVYDSTGIWRGVARNAEAGIWSPSRVISPS